MTTEDGIIDWMKRHDLPITRDGYLALAYPEGEPDPWTEEDEMMLPPDVQLAGEITEDFKEALAQAGYRDWRDPYTQEIIVAFMEAVNHLDASEPAIRDLIEGDLMDIAGFNRTKVSDAITAGNNLAKKIAALREKYIKRAFRHLRDKLPSDL